MVSHAFDENELLEDEVYKQILAGKLQINEGMLYENAIAQMLDWQTDISYIFIHTIMKISIEMIWKLILSFQITAD